MKAKKLYFYGSLLITFGLIVTAIVLFGVYSKERCTVTTDGNSSSCTDQIDFDCTYVFYMTADIGSTSVSMYCPWYSQDVGLGEAALAISFIFVFLVGLRKRHIMKSHRAHLTRICNGFIGFVLLLAATILMFVDLNKVDLPSTIVFSDFEMKTGKSPYVANGIMVILAGVFVLGFTAWETKKYLKKVKKSGKKAKHDKNYQETHEMQAVKVETHETHEMHSVKIETHH